MVEPSPQFAEEGAHLTGEHLWLFQRSEMSTFGHDAPAADVGEDARRGAARWLEDFPRELRVAGGHRDRMADGQDRRAVKAGIIRPEGRTDRPGKPIKRDV